MAALLSVVLHLALLLLVASSASHRDGSDGRDAPIAQLVMLKALTTDRRDGVERAARAPAVAGPIRIEQFERQVAPPSSPPTRDVDDARATKLEELPPVEVVADIDHLPTGPVEPLSTFVMPQAQAAALLRRIERLADQLTRGPRVESTWNEDGRRYTAELVLERARTVLDMDRVVAEISADDRGRQLKTRVLLKRLSFSNFTQVVDSWDPNVGLHADEVVGRMHVNSQFYLVADLEATPALRGKVTTAAGNFFVRRAGRNRHAGLFLAGVETRARRIDLAEDARPFTVAPHEDSARVHEFEHDTSLRFLASGGYWWRDHETGDEEYRQASQDQPMYFIAPRGATIYVQGVVSGKVLVYSPQKIVVEGNLSYARDPREDPDAGDYLGLVCDRDIEVAPPNVTGPGNLEIDAALYARRRFVVTDIDQEQSGATLRIFGSVTAGSLTATEPRFATRIEFDPRFEKARPPGFPSTNRFATEDWDRRWTESRDHTTSRAF